MLALLTQLEQCFRPIDLLTSKKITTCTLQRSLCLNSEIFFLLCSEIRHATKLCLVALSEAPSCVFNNVYIMIFVFKDIHKFGFSLVRFGA